MISSGMSPRLPSHANWMTPQMGDGLARYAHCTDPFHLSPLHFSITTLLPPVSLHSSVPVFVSSIPYKLRPSRSLNLLLSQAEPAKPPQLYCLWKSSADIPIRSAILGLWPARTTRGRLPQASQLLRVLTATKVILQKPSRHMDLEAEKSDGYW